MSQEPLQLSPERLKQIYTLQERGQLILILGWPALGKTTSAAFLPSEHTYVISLEGKALPHPLALGLKRDERKTGVEGNYASTKSRLEIVRILQALKKRPEILYVLVDDLGYYMPNKFMNASTKDWDLYNDLAADLWTIIQTAKDLRPEQKAILVAHLEEEADGGYLVMKTLGKFTKQKITPEGLTDTIFVAAVERTDDNGNARYFFYTQSDGKIPARSLLGMYPYRVPNDLKRLCDRMDEHFAGVSLDDSQIDLEIKVGNSKKLSIRR